MAEQSTSSTSATVATVEANSQADSQAGARVPVVWKFKVLEDDPEAFRQKRKAELEAKKAAKKRRLQGKPSKGQTPGDDDKPAGDEGSSEGSEPAGTSSADSKPDYSDYRLFYQIKVDSNSFAIMGPGGLKLDFKEAGTVYIMVGPKRSRTPQPRVPVIDAFEWVPIAHSSQSYPHDLDEREGAAPHLIGPAVHSKPHICDPEIDIFVIDRGVLSLLEPRPIGSHKANTDIDVFERRKGRDNIENAFLERHLLSLKHVAININDQGSMLIYAELLARAHANGAEPLGDGRTITFFSGPDTCNHDDCNAWRLKHKGMRTPGAQKLMGVQWWMFANFCLRAASSLMFTDKPHARDMMTLLNVKDNAVRQARTWSHALLRHHARLRPTPARRKTGFRLVIPGNDFGKTFRLLVDNQNCLNTERANDDAERARVEAQINPVVVDRCVFCDGESFPLGHYSLGPLPKGQNTGLMYLHYSNEENDGGEMDSGEDEHRTEVQDDTDAQDDTEPKGKGKKKANYKAKGKATASRRRTITDSHG
ncbi:hypothetical protein F5Y05DRAFT_416596 [Hypoxylon sp. FL0543]|nr:hypothetical protein F5Y05DRAFT_416596 [Hypoxylon sp. FL0543]